MNTLYAKVHFKLNDDLKDQLFLLSSATSIYLATITAQLMLRNVVSNSFVTPECQDLEAGQIKLSVT